MGAINLNIYYSNFWRSSKFGTRKNMNFFMCAHINKFFPLKKSRCISWKKNLRYFIPLLLFYEKKIYSNNPNSLVVGTLKAVHECYQCFMDCTKSTVDFRCMNVNSEEFFKWLLDKSQLFNLCWQCTIMKVNSENF